jgi:hypothetical protein
MLNDSRSDQSKEKKEINRAEAEMKRNEWVVGLMGLNVMVVVTKNKSLATDWTFFLRSEELQNACEFQNRRMCLVSVTRALITP